MFYSKMESNDVAKAALNEIWGILLSLINMAGMVESARWLEGGQGDVREACD